MCALGEYLIYAIWIAECDKAKASVRKKTKRDRGTDRDVDRERNIDIDRRDESKYQHG